MIKIFMIVTLFISVDSFGFTLIKDRSIESCAKVSELLSSSVTKLEEAYYLSNTVFCKRKIELRAIKKDEWFSSKYYLENIKKVNKLVSESSLNIEDVALIFELKTRFYLTPQNRELLEKGFLVSLSNNLDFYGTDGDHPYQPHKMAEDAYFDIASNYYMNGMKEDGDRVLNELRQLPHQYLPDIDRAQKWGHESYQKWQLKQQASQEGAEQKNDSIAAEEKKALDKNMFSGSVNALINKGQNITEKSNEVMSVDDKSRMLLLTLLFIAGLYYYSRNKRKG